MHQKWKEAESCKTQKTTTTIYCSTTINCVAK